VKEDSENPLKALSNFEICQITKELKEEGKDVIKKELLEEKPGNTFN
jgi:hypothetical protein